MLGNKCKERQASDGGLQQREPQTEVEVSELWYNQRREKLGWWEVELDTWEKKMAINPLAAYRTYSSAILVRKFLNEARPDMLILSPWKPKLLTFRICLVAISWVFY